MDTGQRSLSYTTLHTNHRNEVLFKSVIALYNMRSKVHWRHKGSLEANLVVIGDELDNVDLDRDILPKLRPSQVVLSLGSRIRATSDRMLYVEPPLRAGEVVKRLEQAEAYLLRILSERPEAAGQYSPEDNEEFNRLKHSKVKLIRWPSAELLREHWDYIRLATMMTHRAMTVDELAQRSKQPEAVCRHFIVSALRAGCAEYVSEDSARRSAAPPAAPATQGFKSLLTKIRMRLGLFNSEAHS